VRHDYYTDHRPPITTENTIPDLAASVVTRHTFSRPSLRHDATRAPERRLLL